jgi:hypothetical protein
VQSIGELHEQNSYVVCDREQKLPQVLGLLGALRDEIELLDFRQAVDEVADVLAELPGDLRAGDARVLDRVV